MSMNAFRRLRVITEKYADTVCRRSPPSARIGPAVINLIGDLATRLSGTGGIAQAMFLGAGLGWTVAAAAVERAGMGEAVLVRGNMHVQVYRLPMAGSRIPAVSARTTFSASADAVFNVISDYAHFSEFIPMVAESHVLDHDTLATRVYQRLDLPFPVVDRHYIIDITQDLRAASTGVIDVAWSLDAQRSESLPYSGAVVPRVFSGSWHLTSPEGSTRCDAVYTVHVDPGGAVPDWLVLSLTERYVIRVVGAVSKRLTTDGR